MGAIWVKPTNRGPTPNGSLIKLPAYRDGQHLLAEGGEKTSDEVKEKIPIAQHRVGIRRRQERGSIQGVSSSSEIAHSWANYNRLGQNFKPWTRLKAANGGFQKRDEEFPASLFYCFE